MGKREEIVFRCLFCKHYYNFGLRMCKAFLEIPEEIFTGSNDHSKPLPDQDSDIVFEEKKKRKKKR